MLCLLVVFAFPRVDVSEMESSATLRGRGMWICVLSRLVVTKDHFRLITWNTYESRVLQGLIEEMLTRTGRQPTKITWKSPVSKTSGEYMLIRAPKPPK